MLFQTNPENIHVLNPLFWHRGDCHAVIEEEMRRMKEVGINDFVVEPRPHPDYLGPRWWQDLDFILEQAEKLNMIVWLFDDGDYPSGVANGELAEKYPQHTKRYWLENHMDASGPLPHAHFLIDDWLREGESLYRVVAARRTDRQETLDSDSLVDLTHLVSGGRLYWPVPEGEWRVFVIKISPCGQEAHTQNYVNPLSREGVSKYIELVHERHYAHYAPLFGNRIAGFFTDEPRFGNITGYDRVIGKSRMPLPWAEEVTSLLNDTPLGNFDRLIPLLWYDDAQGKCRDVRYAYMDVVSRLFAQNFTGQLGDWCRGHNVLLVGHLVEENGAHSRLGYGAGHFFRAMEGLDAGGIDVVDNLMPEQTSGCYSTAFNEFDCDFSHWGLAKMAAYAAHADPKKHGRVLCEDFGAYGWFEGLRLMKWITDHLAVQGVNIITPHAFSPAPFPDPDCPPHFYARGENPQFRLFHVWSNYANRLLEPLTEAAHVALVAVVYHAEAEWGGECEPFEKAVKALAQHQIDSDVVSIDTLLSPETYVENGLLHAGTEIFRALVVPYAQLLPGAFVEKLRAFLQAGLKVCFTRALPQRAYFGGPVSLPGAEAVPTQDLPQALAACADVVCAPSSPDLLYAHYQKNGADLYLFVNQSTRSAVDTHIAFRENRTALVYDPMTDTRALPRQDPSGDRTLLRLQLEPWESRLVVFGCDTENLPALSYEAAATPVAVFREGWTISTATASEYPSFRETPFHETGDLSRPGFLPEFSGTLRYERAFSLEKPEDLTLDLGDAYEAVAVWVNGTLAAEKICPPYRVELPAALLRAGENRLRIEVTNTLVKAHSHNSFDPYFPQDPTGLVDPVRLMRK